MTPYRKKLIEVALPLKAINEASAREKSIRHGHPSTLHIWWARRPLATCRAVLFASLVDDPDSDPAYRKTDGSVDEERAAVKRAQLFDLIEELVRWENSNNPRIINQARAEIARCLASRRIELAELSKDTIIFGDKKGGAHAKGAVSGEGITAWEILLMQAQPEVVNAFLAAYAPHVLDPFCGGGSIPLEAQRLGLRAFASDLNPVPVLITKALIEIPPKFAGRSPVNPDWQAESEGQKVTTIWHGAQGLAEDVRYYGQWIRDEAQKRIGHLYPKVKITAEMAKDRSALQEYVGQELTVIAWLWARTVASPNPVCKGAHVPLVSSLMLSAKAGKKTWAEIICDSSATDGWRFRVRSGDISKEAEAKAKSGTRAGKAKDFICALTEVPIARTYIQTQGKANLLRVRLMAVVCEGRHGRVYLSPDEHSEAVASSASKMQIVEQSRQSFLSGTTPTRAMITGGVCSAYGLSTWGHLFTPRQVLVLTTFCNLVQEVRERVQRDAVPTGLPTDNLPLTDGGIGATAYADAVATYLSFAIDRGVDRSTTLCTWDSSPKMEALRSTFARQALPMTWDFAEGNPFSESSGNWGKNLDWVTMALRVLPSALPGSATQLDATAAVEVAKGSIVSTDPPYYDNISYAELSDFFYIWLRRSLSSVYPSLFATLLTPKKQELIASAYRHDGNRESAQSFFEEGLGQAFARMRAVQNTDCPLTVYYAFKQSEADESDDEESESTPTVSTGWETMLAGLIHAGFSVHGTWPMRTELGNRMVSMGTNALASSIVLVCRPRPVNASLATRKEFMNALRRELPEALKNLQHGNIAPVDLAQAAIGPGMAIFTRYSKVIETDGQPMTVRTALGIINQVLDEVLAEQEGDFDAPTRWALAWFEQFGTAEGSFGVAETLSKAKNTSVGGLVEAGIVKARAGKVQFIGRNDLSEHWDPTTDKRLTVWETTQHLIRALETKGEGEAAALLNKLGGMAETARELAYRLYSICERKKWAEEALAYNGLVIAWPELTKLAVAERTRQPSTQTDLFS